MRLDFVYIGFSARALNKMLESKTMRLTTVITRRGKMDDDILNTLSQHGIVVEFVENKKELSDIIKRMGNKLYIMYVFNIIIPEDIANAYNIINIHGGDLRTNRGKNPISWNILLNEKNAVMSVHKITGEIDKGLLLGEIKIPIAETDNYRSVSLKTLETWEEIEKIIIAYSNGEIAGTEIKDGIYRRAVTEADYTINWDDSERTIVQKIKAEVGFRGAIIKQGNLKLYVTDWEYIDT